ATLRVYGLVALATFLATVEEGEPVYLSAVYLMGKLTNATALLWFLKVGVQPSRPGQAALRVTGIASNSPRFGKMAHANCFRLSQDDSPSGPKRVVSAITSLRLKRFKMSTPGLTRTRPHLKILLQVQIDLVRPGAVEGPWWN